MNPLDQELKNALRREEPPADFAERVLARLQTVPAPQPSWGETLRHFFRFPALRWATTGALCMGLLVGVVAYRRHQQTVAQGENAREQVMLALHITSSKLNVAFRQVQRTDELQGARSVPRSE
jgi:predicted LPLAT superfamily acyltransferase